MSRLNSGAIILSAAGRASAQEQLVDRALRANTLALAKQLRAVGVEHVVVAGPDLDWLCGERGITLDRDSMPFHFGRRLAGLIARYGMAPVFYFGAGSGPLLPADALADALARLLAGEASGARRVVTNNLHSCDWLGLSRPKDALPVIQAAQRDNGLAWSLQEEGGYSIEIAPGPDTPAQLDLDTPADLALARVHPACPPALRTALDDPMLDRIPVGDLANVLAEDGSRVALVGRVAPPAWQALSRATRCWIRVYSEERGMAASERLARGEVRSLIATLLRMLGPDRFFAELGMMADAAIIDSRVLMAASGAYPPAADRFASDLLLPEWIDDPWLRDFTRAAANAGYPVLLGGHGVVSGGLYALVDRVQSQRQANHDPQ